MSIHNLPAEVLVLIFKRLKSKDVDNCRKTCVKWKGIVSVFIYGPRLDNLAKYDINLTNALSEKGWTTNCDDVDLIIALTEKLSSNTRYLNPTKNLGPVKIYFPLPNTKELSHSALYHDKMFLSFSDGTVQSRSLEDFSLLQELHEATSVSPSLNSFVPLCVFGNYLLCVFQPNSNLIPIHLWNANTQENVFSSTVPIPSTVTYVKDISINFTHIVMATNSNIIALKVSWNPIQILEHKLIDQPSSPGLELERFYLDLNEDYLIVMTGLVTPYNRQIASKDIKRKSLLQCRSLKDYAAFWPIAGIIESLEIESIKVSSSKYNVLACMYLDSTQSQFNYKILLFEMVSGNILKNVFETDSDLKMPLKWLDNQLFMKVTPKKAFSSLPFYENEDAKETLAILNIETLDEYFVPTINLRSYGRHILIDFTKLVEISIHVSEDGVPYDRHQLAGHLYECKMR